jgi:hypothetical protein
MVFQEESIATSFDLFYFLRTFSAVNLYKMLPSFAKNATNSNDFKAWYIKKMEWKSRIVAYKA